MFLNVLDQEERIKCMELFHFVVNVDGNYSEEEHQLLENYKIQLNLAEFPIVEESLEELLNYFAAKPESIRKMLYFEICGLILADDNIAKTELDLLENIKVKFDIKKETSDKIMDLVNSLQNIYDEIYEVLA